MSEVNHFPDHAWFDGKIASWEGRRFGYVALYEVIGEPKTFKEIVNSAGQDEIIELHDARDGQVLSLTFVDKDNDNALLDQPSVVLTAESPTTIIPEGSRFIMDTTSTSVEGNLAYTCIAFGLKELK